MYPNAQQLVDSLKQTIEREREFDSFVMESLKPPAGPYAIFYHHGHLLERTQDVSYMYYRWSTLNNTCSLIEAYVSIRFITNVCNF